MHIQYIYKYIFKYTSRLCCFRYQRFINFLTSVFWHEERDTILTILTIPKNAVHLVMFKITVGRDPKNPTTCLNGRELNSMPQWQKLDFHPSWSNLNSRLTLFQNLQILRTISSGHDVIHTPVPFSVWVFLWQWFLSYPLRASVKLYPMTMHLNS